MEIAGKTALVTGAARRVGREIAIHLARAGADILLHYHRSHDDAEATARDIRALGRACTTLSADLRDAEATERLAASALAAPGGPPAVLVNSASVFHPTPLDALTAAEWDAVMAVNLRAPFQLARALGPAMAARGGGKIINIADGAIRRPYRRHLPYLVSKSALEAMTRVLALELAPAVQVNTVAPGTVLFSGDQSPALRDAIVRATPLGRVGEPADVAAMVAHLVLHGDFVTGAFVAVDGGVGIPG